MSALPPKADIRQRIEHVCFVPLVDTIFVFGAKAWRQALFQQAVRITRPQRGLLWERSVSSTVSFVVAMSHEWRGLHGRRFPEQGKIR